MKKYLALFLAVLMLAAVFAGCAGKGTSTGTSAKEGKVFNIYAWNEEFKGFFEKYYTVPEGVTVNWIITPSADGAYQDKLDEALLNQENASADDKVDLFLAEADYIQKYTESSVTQDVAALGVTDFSNTYAYTVQAASDASGVVKGVSFQCCPAALIYRRSIAKDVLGTDTIHSPFFINISARSRASAESAWGTAPAVRTAYPPSEQFLPAAKRPRSSPWGRPAPGRGRCCSASPSRR